MNSRKALLLALSGGLMLSTTTMASAADADLQAEVAALRAEVAQLKQQNQSDNWLNERRAEEIKSLVRDVLSDADTRASLQGGLTAGHDGKFFLASEDGSFRMNVSGQLQARYIYNSRDQAEQNAALGDDKEAGFQLRRGKVKFAGHIVDPSWTYTMQLASNRSSTDVYLEVATIGKEIADGVEVVVGRQKAPFLREELISSSKQLTVERSLMNEFFTSGHVEGILLKAMAGDNVKIQGMLHDGPNSGEAFVGSDFHQDNADLAVTGRVDVLLGGSWKQAEDFSSWSDEDNLIAVGAAAEYYVEETGDNDIAGANSNGEVFKATADASMEAAGLGLYGALVYLNSHDFANNVDQWGAVIQGSYNINDQIEPFVRLEYINPDFSHEVTLVTVGANYYIAKHNAKVTVDLVYAFDSLDGIGGSSGLGLLTDDTDDAEQLAIRAQVQLLF